MDQTTKLRCLGVNDDHDETTKTWWTDSCRGVYYYGYVSHPIETVLALLVQISFQTKKPVSVGYTFWTTPPTAGISNTAGTSASSTQGRVLLLHVVYSKSTSVPLHYIIHGQRFIFIIIKP